MRSAMDARMACHAGGVVPSAPGSYAAARRLQVIEFKAEYLVEREGLEPAL